ncbi:protein lplB [Paenibacillus rhizosphaerae]|uniref:Protein lplB n=1 Tax=Paenibacillus rhizosphaerae TaxID=297318 RepID=A0A1R1EC79_9BACL|nr:ABC transporter permease subunit [Paenibacillus rhizosphaerae]OMF49424.1 protein lplB [Paenibacillus rhizosphaerae]
MKTKSRIFRQNIPLIVMFVPVALFFIIFKYLPMGGLIIAFKDYSFRDGILGSPWAGLKNFEALFSQPQTLQIIRNTLVISILNIIIGFPFPILLAILLNEVRKSWFKRWTQTLVYIPHFMSWIVVGGIVVTLFAQEQGIVNEVLYRLFGFKVPFLYQQSSWLAVFLGSGIWKDAGWNAIIYMAALSSIDPALYEAAGLDGAGKLKQIWNVTIPGMLPTIILMLILSMGHFMEVGFDQIYILKNPVVSDISEVISTYIYRLGMQNGEFSLTTALGLFESAIALLLVLTTNKIAHKFGQGLW